MDTGYEQAMQELTADEDKSPQVVTTMQHVLILDDQQNVYGLFKGTEEQIRQWLSDRGFVPLYQGEHVRCHSSNEVEGVVEALKDKEGFMAVIIDVPNDCVESIPVN